MEIFITGDTHWFHANVIQYCNRPFANVNEMNDKLIENWNKIIPKENSIVFHLGDVSMNSANPKTVEYRKERLAEIFKNLNGVEKVLIMGNHDEQYRDFYKTIFTSVEDYLEIYHENKLICMFHYPIEFWHGASKGSISLHGHSHGHATVRKNRLDCGVDCNNYFPFSLREVLQKIEKQNHEVEIIKHNQ